MRHRHRLLRRRSTIPAVRLGTRRVVTRIILRIVMRRWHRHFALLGHRMTRMHDFRCFLVRGVTMVLVVLLHVVLYMSVSMMVRLLVLRRSRVLMLGPRRLAVRMLFVCFAFKHVLPIHVRLPHLRLVCVAVGRRVVRLPVVGVNVVHLLFVCSLVARHRFVCHFFMHDPVGRHCVARHCVGRHLLVRYFVSRLRAHFLFAPFFFLRPLFLRFLHEHFLSLGLLIQRRWLSRLHTTSLRLDRNLVLRRDHRLIHILIAHDHRTVHPTPHIDHVHVAQKYFHVVPVRHVHVPLVRHRELDFDVVRARDAHVLVVAIRGGIAAWRILSRHIP